MENIKEFESYDDDEEESTDTEDEEDREEEENEEVEEAKRAKFRLMGPLGKIHNIVVYIRRLPSRTKEFLKYAKRRVPLSNKTRWNSWYRMLNVALAKRSGIERYCQNHETALQKDELSPDDWRRLRTIEEFLEPFYLATLFTEGHLATIDRVLFMMDVIQKHLQTSLVSITLFYI